MARDVTNSIVTTQELLATLPKLLAAWQQGEADVQGLPLDVMHGPFAAADMYKLQTSRSKPRASYVCMPDIEPLYTALLKRAPGSYWEKNAGPDHDIRLIVSTSDANSELGRNQLAYEIHAGSQVRMHPTPPSFFWILDHTRIGIPFTWGQAWPGRIMAMDSPALAQILSWVYHRIWEEAVPVAGHAHRWESPWDPILRLMNSGMPMETASTALGLSARTGRRRVSDAMRHFGVSSQFSLGAAWSATHNRADSSASDGTVSSAI